MADGIFQAVTPPQLGGLESLRVSNEAQFRQLAGDDAERQFVHWTVWAALPDKYQEGDQYYLAAGVVRAGSPAGLYVYTGSGWIFNGNYPPARGGIYSNTPQAQSVDTTWSKITCYNTASDDPFDVTIDLANDRLIVNRGGYFVAQCVMEVINNSPNQTYHLAFYRNGALAPVTQVQHTAKDNNDGFTLNTIIAAALSEGDVIETYWYRTTAGSVTVNSALFQLVMQS